MTSGCPEVFWGWPQGQHPSPSGKLGPGLGVMCMGRDHLARRIGARFIDLIMPAGRLGESAAPLVSEKPALRKIYRPPYTTVSPTLPVDGPDHRDSLIPQDSPRQPGGRLWKMHPVQGAPLPLPQLTEVVRMSGLQITPVSCGGSAGGPGGTGGGCGKEGAAAT